MTSGLSPDDATRAAGLERALMTSIYAEIRINLERIGKKSNNSET